MNSTKQKDYHASHKPIIWSLFAAGGTVTALLWPALIVLISLAVPMDLLSADLFSYTRIQDLISNPLVKLTIFGIIFLSLWYAAHRMRCTLHDFGVRADGLVIVIFYGTAFVMSMILAVALI
jgi:fumarate reductase subunit D